MRESTDLTVRVAFAVALTMSRMAGIAATLDGAHEVWPLSTSKTTSPINTRESMQKSDGSESVQLTPAPAPPRSYSFDSSQPDRPAHLRVLLRDSRSGVAVRGRMVSTGANDVLSVESTDTGAFLSVDYTAGNRLLEVSSPGHRPLSTKVTLDAGSDLTTTIWLDPVEVPEVLRTESVESRMQPGMLLLHGHIVDSETALPLENVAVHLALSSGEARTNSDGYFWLLVVAKHNDETDSLIATIGGYRSFVLTNVLLREGDVHVIIDMVRGSGSTIHDGTHKLLTSATSAPISESQATSSVASQPSVFGESLRISPQSVSLPSSIRVGFNCPSSLSCTTVHVYSLETYVANGLDDEWIPSWTAESLKAGAVAYRSYGAYYTFHPMTATYDICSTTACQVDDPSTTTSSVQSAAAATAGVILVNAAGTEPFFAQYSAHNNNLCPSGTCSGGGYTWTSCGDGYCGRPPTWPCLSDSVESGVALSGHGGGMSQWGSYRWDQQGQGWQWIVNHYYNNNGNPSGARNGVLQFGTTAATVTINSASTIPSTTPTISTFTIQYNVTASAASAVMLGASLRLHGTTSWAINDSPHDITVSLPAGSSSVSRQFSVSAASGLYDVLVAVWRDQNGNGIIDGPDSQLSAVTLMSAETLSDAQSCNSLVLMSNPSNGGSISANPSASIPCNFGYYLSGTPITLTATAASGYQFSNWGGSGGSFSNLNQALTTFTITGNAQVTATFAATQVACAYSISPTSAPGSGGGGSGSVTVTGSPSGCTGSWSATANSAGSWLTLTGTTSGSGSSTIQVPYSYTTNPSTSSSRTGTVSFSGSFPSGNTFTLTQSPATAGACTYWITPTSAPGAGSGGSGSVQVTGSPSGCSGNWSAVASSSGNWLTLTGTANGSGANTWQVPYSFGANPSTTSTRAGTISFSFGNTFTLTQDAAVGNDLPNLTPYQPAGWSNKIVVSTVSGTNTDANSFTPSDSLYVDWAVINNGLVGTTAQFYTQLLVDGNAVGSWYTDPFGSGWYAYVEDFPLGTLAAGVHTITIQTDTTGAIAESDESDNQFSRTIVVGGGGGQHLNSLGDFNGDHKADVLWRIDANGLNATWLMNGITKAVGQYLESAGPQWIVAGIGDFDGDGKADILWRNPVSGEDAMWLMNGTTKTLGTYIESAGPQWVVAGVGDFNGDGKADILWRNPATGDDAMWLMNGPTKAVGVLIESAGPNWTVVGVGDFNGDGMADILWRDDAAGNDAMWLMNGPTKAVGALIEGAPSRWRVVGVGDFNVDGRADILWRDPVNGENAMWLMNGPTKALGSYLESAGPQWIVAGVGDLDGDGKADIFWRDTSGFDAIWLMNGTVKTVGSYTETAPLPWRVAP